MDMPLIPIVDSLEKYVYNESYMGFDPYDILNSTLPLHKLGKYGMVVLLQLQKNSPINFRGLFNVKKGINPKGMALFASAYINLFKLTGQEEYLNKAESLLIWLLNNKNSNFKGSAWGYNFRWASREKIVPNNHPSIVVTSFVGRALHEFYLLKGGDEFLETLLGIWHYIDNHLHITETPNGICFSYTDIVKDCCYNASMLATETLGYIYYHNHECKLFELAQNATSFVISHQKEDGRWNYSIDIKTGKEDEQLDFHQGFILESLHSITSTFNFRDNVYIDSYKKGLNFYYKNLFLNDGRMKWRYPNIYPIDIHNQAQGIITFSNSSNINSAFMPAAQKIVEWTCKNMLDPNGYFYHRVNRCFKNKTSYIRWSQAWMMKALADYLISIKASQ